MLTAANAAAPAPRTAAEFQVRDDFLVFPAAVEGARDICVFKLIFSLRRPATLGREQPAQVLRCASANMLQCSKVQTSFVAACTRFTPYRLRDALNLLIARVLVDADPALMHDRERLLAAVKDENGGQPSGLSSRSGKSKP